MQNRQCKTQNEEMGLPSPHFAFCITRFAFCIAFSSDRQHRRDARVPVDDRHRGLELLGFHLGRDERRAVAQGLAVEDGADLSDHRPRRGLQRRQRRQHLRLVDFQLPRDGLEGPFSQRHLRLDRVQQLSAQVIQQNRHRLTSAAASGAARIHLLKFSSVTAVLTIGKT